MPRAFLVVMDSVGIGGAPDAHKFFQRGHPRHRREHGRPHRRIRGPPRPDPRRAWSRRGAAPRVRDDPSRPSHRPHRRMGRRDRSLEWQGHALGPLGTRGRPVPWDWTTFPATEPCFPDTLVAEVCRIAGTTGILGNRHSSGTLIIVEEARVTWRLAGPSATPPRTPCSRSPRTRNASASTASSTSAKRSPPRSTPSRRPRHRPPLRRRRDHGFHPHRQPPRLCHRSPVAHALRLGA